MTRPVERCPGCQEWRYADGRCFTPGCSGDRHVPDVKLLPDMKLLPYQEALFSRGPLRVVRNERRCDKRPVHGGYPNL